MMMYQAREDGTLDLGGSNEDKRSDLGCMLKVEPKGFAARSPR
jgi:hypothetical protein